MKGVDRVIGAVGASLVGLVVGGVTLALYGLTCIGGGFLCDLYQVQADPTLAGLFLALGLACATSGIAAAFAFVLNQRMAALVASGLFLGLVLGWGIVLVSL